MSWLADSQMHKVGYPNLHAGYSEEDSRDAVDLNNHNEMEISGRVTRNRNDIGVHRESKNSKYLFDYDNEELPPRRRNTPRGNIVKKEIQSERRESNDKENKKDNFQFNGRLRSRKSETYTEVKEENQNVEAGGLSEDKETNQEDAKENGEHSK